MNTNTLALEARLAEIMPLFQEARDALPAINNVSASLYGVDLTLADRMDAVGTKNWRAALEAEAVQEPVEPIESAMGLDGCALTNLAKLNIREPK